MRLTVTTNEQTWEFELIKTGGKSTPTSTTSTTGNKLHFESHITVALHSQISSMNSLYRLLVTLTHNFWHGLIIHNEHATQATLTSYEVRLPKVQEGEIGAYICEVGYKVIMPQDAIENYDFRIEGIEDNE